MGVDQGFQLADELLGRPEVEAGGEVVLDQPKARLLDPRPVRREPGTVPRIREEVSSEEPQGLRGRVPGRLGVAGGP